MSSKALSDQHAQQRDQNTKLRQVISDMRAELESISNLQTATANEIAVLKDVNKEHIDRIDVLDGLVDSRRAAPLAPGRERDRDELLLLRKQVERLNRTLLEAHDRVVQANKDVLQQRLSSRKVIHELEQRLQDAEDNVDRSRNRDRSPQVDRAEPNYHDEIMYLRGALEDSALQLHEYRVAKETAERRLEGCRREAQALEQELQQQRQLVDDLRARLRSSSSPSQPDRLRSSEASTLKDLREENSDLRERLDEARQELAQLDAEKEKLMEISNMLKANVSKLVSNENVGDLPLSYLDSTGEVASAYNSRIAQLERTLRSLLQQNQQLRSQIRSIISKEREHVAFHRHPGATEFCSDPLCQFRLVHQYGTSLLAQGTAQANVLANIDRLDHDIQASLRLSADPPAVGDLTQRDPDEVDIVPAQQASRPDDTRARRRLRQELGELGQTAPATQHLIGSAKRSFRLARDSSAMSMSGQAIGVRAPAGRSWSRIEPEDGENVRQQQRADKMRKESRRRATLLKQRQAIRNYNIAD